MAQGKCWCFTLNNPVQADHEDLAALDCVYLVYGDELAPTSGTPHLQGYVVFSKNKRFSAVKNLLSPRYHLELAKGSTEQNVAYCTKDGWVTERGTKPLSKKEIGQNERERWKEIIRHAKEGTLEEYDPKVYYSTLNTAQKLQAQYQKPVGITKRVRVFYGPTQTGKSFSAWSQLGPDAFAKDPRSKFWYGYHGQTKMIIDEFRGGIDISHMLRWLDCYPLMVEVKNSSCACLVDEIIITSNLHPSKWYPELDQDTIDALLRRMEIVHFSDFFNKHKSN